MNRIYRWIFLSFIATTGLAWGPAGHEIVGRIAEQRLTPATTQFIRELHNPEIHIADAGIADWADFIRRERPETAPWHYVDIPFDARKYDPERDCRQPAGCVISAIEKFRHVLADRQANSAARIEALKFLVHFVGDIHQPLHCAERHGDHGGNLVLVHWPGEPQALKLHAVWDGRFVEKNLRDQKLTAPEYADQLNHAVTAAQLQAWSAGAPADWALESHRLAVTEVYATIPETGAARQLDDAYITKNQHLVAEQFTKAGIRLAYLLNLIATNR